MFDIFQSYLKTCLQFLRLVNVMFCMKTCLHKMSSIFTQMCLYNVWTMLTKINDICYEIFEAIVQLGLDVKLNTKIGLDTTHPPQTFRPLPGLLGG